MSESRTKMNIALKLSRLSAQNGTRLEVTLFTGAQFDNGLTSGVPAIDMQGYDPAKKMRSEPGVKVTGYVVSYNKSTGQLVMSSDWRGRSPGHDLSDWYVDEKCIHSVRR